MSDCIRLWESWNSSTALCIHELCVIKFSITACPLCAGFFDGAFKVKDAAEVSAPGFVGLRYWDDLLGKPDSEA